MPNDNHRIAEKIVAELLPYLTGPRWLKLKQACLYSAIGKERLKQLAIEGEVIGFRDPDSKRHDWIFCRHSLDRYRLRQSGSEDRKVLAILKGLK